MKTTKINGQVYDVKAVGTAVVKELHSTAVMTNQKQPISKLEFMSLFTDVELAAIFTAAKTNVAMEVWVEKLKAATQVHLDNPAVIAGVKALEAAKLLAAGRAAAILK